MKTIHIDITDNTACGYYRSTLPALLCKEQLLSEGIELVIGQPFNLQSKHNAYIFHRTPDPVSTPYFHQLWSRGSTIVWDLDDNIFHIPEHSPAVEMRHPHNFAATVFALTISDFITVTTERFASLSPFTQFVGWRKKLHVLPNLVDLTPWQFPSYKSSHTIPRVLWAGSATHSADLDLVVPAIKQILDEKKYSVQFIFMGMMPAEFDYQRNPEALAYGNSVLQFPSCPLMHYPGALNLIAPDIALMPLVDNIFNQSKSNIKYLEMTMASAVCIASDVGPYEDTIQNGFDGYLCSGEDDWYIRINRMLDDVVASRIRFGNVLTNAYMKVEREWSWTSQKREMWLQFFRRIVDYKRWPDAGPLNPLTGEEIAG